ncbi:putative 28S ribosomal protein S10, mitochondrial [Apostichopus japonicus]|uniref:Small ribosomal subunit protein uS10m n=1 Tax=Stichopus japonicus TaxID=307972 RepID=A0A2G8JHZ3_STIJA|nr:putative 28S ribosomal protein S10, mitochondrial [Apostichopus japonicus]
MHLLISPNNQNLSNDKEEEDQLYKWIELKVKGHDNAVLDSYQTFVSSAAKELDIKFEILEHPGRDIYRLTLLKSRHIYKKHRVQYEMRTNYRLMKLRHLTGTTADVFLEYIERNLPEGLAMQVKKCSIEQMPEHLTKPPEGLEESLPEEQEEMRPGLSSSSSSSDEVEEVDESSSSPPEETEKTEDSSSDSDSDSSSDSDSDSDEEDEKR